MKASHRCAVALVILSAVGAAGAAAAGPPDRMFCNVPDLGTSTGLWPPVGCSYISPQEVFMIIDGLPPGSTIELDPLFYGLACTNPTCEAPGGMLGGTLTQFTGTLQLHVTGTGDLAGFQRIIEVSVVSEVHAGPRTPGDSIQTFNTDYFSLAGQLVGDPDFDSLQITGGTSYGLPGPGLATMRERPGGAYSVDSFFDLTYQIDFTGAPGSALEGLSGVTTATIRLAVERPPLPVGACEAPDNGTGTADLPPADCIYLNPEEPIEIIDGLPAGTTLELQLQQSAFVCDFMPCGQPGGGFPGGEAESFDSQMVFEVRGTGSLSGYSRTLTLPGDQVDHSGARTPGDPIQHFQALISSLTASLAGDPDFAVLTFTAGDAEGLRSPGMTTIADVGGGAFAVDSFFDVSYRIEFTGAPGSVLEGFSGTPSARPESSLGSSRSSPTVSKRATPAGGRGRYRSVCRSTHRVVLPSRLHIG